MLLLTIPMQVVLMLRISLHGWPQTTSSWTPNFGPQAGFWSKNYKGIYRANLYLEKIDAIDDASEAFKTRTKAEVHFLRAKFYFDLVRSFGNIP
jgi:hypothetical protein